MAEPDEPVAIDEPLVWHYGLVARWWAEFNTEGPEIAHFQQLIERFGEPALDVACGTGRLLIPYLRAGLDVDGCDISGDMLKGCRRRAEREGLEPRLYEQPMHELDLPRTYRTIVVCGGFGVGGVREHDIEALACFHRHLEPGGALALDTHLPYKDPKAWELWTRQGRSRLPQPWPEAGMRKRTADDEELELRIRILDLDPLDQLLKLQMRALLYRDGLVVEEEERTLVERLYFRDELVSLLEQAGFEDIEVLGDYTPHEAGPDSQILIFIARKPTQHRSGRQETTPTR